MTNSQMNSLHDDLWPGFNEYSKGHKHPLGQEFQERIYNTGQTI